MVFLGKSCRKTYGEPWRTFLEGFGLPWRIFLEDLKVFLGGPSVFLGKSSRKTYGEPWRTFLESLGLPWRTFLKDLGVFLEGPLVFPWRNLLEVPSWKGQEPPDADHHPRPERRITLLILKNLVGWGGRTQKSITTNPYTLSPTCRDLFLLFLVPPS